MNVEPREWQRAALERWRAEFRGVVEVVTGGGKTTFAHLCSELFFGSHPDGAVVILVPTLALLDQWVVSLEEDAGASSSEIATYSGETHSPSASRFNVITLNTGRALAPLLPDTQAGFLVVDECHRAASPENAKALAGPYRATLGLSATPRRQYDMKFEEVIEPALGDVVYEYGYNEARRDGVISPFRLVNVKFPLSEKEQQRYNALTRRVMPLLKEYQRTGEASPRLTRLLLQRSRVAATAKLRIPAAVRLVEENRGERAIVFHEDIAAADEITRILKSRGHRAATYHSALGPELRRDNLRMFRRGLFDVLVTCRALDEGVNVPQAAVAVVASATASSRQRIQRMGRVLRPAAGKAAAVVYTLFATEPEEKRLQAEADALDTAESVEWRVVQVSGA